MLPYKKINIGDIYPSRFNSMGSDMYWEVISKDDDEKLIEVKSSYQHPALPKTIWMKAKNPIFR